MAIDLTKPIDINVFNNTAVQHSKDIKTVNMLKAEDALKLMSLEMDVKDSRKIYEYNPTGGNSRKYDGVFTGGSLGKMTGRTITVYPIVFEMSDEPERYRRSFMNDFALKKVDETTLFELWLLQRGIEQASEELYNAIWSAKRDDDEAKKGIEYAFDGIATIIDADITAGTISTANKNLYDAGSAMSVANIGEILLEMWRSAHQTFKEKGGIMIMNHTMAEMYDSWYQAQHDKPPMIDVAGQMFLEGTNGKCKIVRLGCIPEASQQIVLTSDMNLCYGIDDLNDLKKLRAFNSGNPYMFTANMKYVFGTQIRSVHPRNFVTNKLYEAELI